MCSTVQTMLEFSNRLLLRFQKAQVAKAEADYAVANEKCDNKVGNDKDICVKEAKAVETSIKADAEAKMKISETNQTANEKSAEAGVKASAEGTEAAIPGLFLSL